MLFMKKRFPRLMAACAFAAFISASPYPEPSPKETLRESIVSKKLSAAGCSPNLALLQLDDPATTIPLLGGWGSYEMPVTATNDSARIYFQQGINMYYAFHIIEALASFDKATKIDPQFAMGYWGKALAYGPNINDEAYVATPEAWTAVTLANANKAACTAAEQALIAAMTVRYSPDTTQMRGHLNQLYANAMKKVYAQYRNNTDIAALYTDALMLLHPWDLYEKNGQPKAWTPEIVQNLETILQTTPGHPGAVHYYIHAVEASNHPEKALAAAGRLPGMMPGVSHVVHMPAHIYIRTGNYKMGEAVNEQAVKSYYDYLGKYAPVANNTPLYLIHNLHMQATCASMEGKFAAAQQLGIDTRNSLDSTWQDMPGFFGVYVQYLYMTPYLSLIRFGKWDEILLTATIPERHVYANLLWHYGRGLAYVRKHKAALAVNELRAMQQAVKHPQLSAPAPSYANPGINGAMIAIHILQGVMAEERNDLPTAIHFLQQAVEREDSMTYNEPRDWVHPARQYLGNALLKAKQYANAEKVFRQDLLQNPNNGWAYTGLSEALLQQGKKGESEEIKSLAAQAFADADMRVEHAVY